MYWEWLWLCAVTSAGVLLVVIIIPIKLAYKSKFHACTCSADYFFTAAIVTNLLSIINTLYVYTICEFSFTLQIVYGHMMVTFQSLLLKSILAQFIWEIKLKCKKNKTTFISVISIWKENKRQKKKKNYYHEMKKENVAVSPSRCIQLLTGIF